MCIAPLMPGGWLAGTRHMDHSTHDAAHWGKPQEMGVLGYLMHALGRRPHEMLEKKEGMK